MEWIRVSSYQALSLKAAHMISEQILQRPDCVLGLATGSTPIGVYERLVEYFQKGEVDFSKVRTVNLDEYCGLEADHSQSYRSFMAQHLFSKVNINRANTYIPDGNAPNISEECRRYDDVIQSLGGIDLQILGIGHNGHIGFNEPGTVFIKDTHCVTLDEKTIEANSRFFNNRSQVPKRAVTMGIRTIMQARKIVLLVHGEDKKDILERAFGTVIDPGTPASILQLHPDLCVIAHV